MTLPLIYYPSPLLRTITQPLTQITAETRRLVTGMRDTMYASQALGIAAPQVGALERIFLIDGKQKPGAKGDPPPLVFINPEVLLTDGSVSMQEGCLSLPSVFLNIVRPRQVTMQAMDLEGHQFMVDATGEFARVLLHEFDHLEGRLMFDLLSPFQRDRAQLRVKSWRAANGM